MSLQPKKETRFSKAPFLLIYLDERGGGKCYSSTKPKYDEGCMYQHQ